MKLINIILLQTLSTAWAANSLEESYFQKWLTNTNHELERLEQDAAPAGWLCQWDRYGIPYIICTNFLCKYRYFIHDIYVRWLYMCIIIYTMKIHKHLFIYSYMQYCYVLLHYFTHHRKYSFVANL